MTTVVKSPSARRRRNHVSTQATLRVLDPSEINIPELPPRRLWQDSTIQRWTALFSSPMASEFTPADLYNLYDLAELWDDFALAGDFEDRIKLSKEIRIKGAAFGLSPIDRRRLSWEIEKGEQAEVQTRARRERRVIEVEAKAGDDVYASLA